MAKRVARPGVRGGYDRWAATYDATTNALIALDRRHTMPYLDARPGEQILDAGCGTGGHVEALLRAGSRPVGLDVSHGMLRVARRKHPSVPLVQADLGRTLPARDGVFDAVLCALVGEHLANLSLLFREMYRSLARGGRLVFSVFHPDVAAACVEANFADGDTEVRLGAIRHGIDDYLGATDDAGFDDIATRVYPGDAALVAEVPTATKYLDRPLLLVATARKAA
jgi:ubiquinone/menaquinone biosynthesis C-methylase UbiE